VQRFRCTEIDKQSIATIRKLEQLGYTFAGDEWIHSANDAAAVGPNITDELHAMLVKRTDDLEGCAAGSDEERELAAIERAIGAYEAVRWPTGKIAGGKGYGGVEYEV
jgi:hypothetical protein